MGNTNKVVGLTSGYTKNIKIHTRNSLEKYKSMPKTYKKKISAYWDKPQ